MGEYKATLKLTTKDCMVPTREMREASSLSKAALASLSSPGSLIVATSQPFEAAGLWLLLNEGKGVGGMSLARPCTMAAAAKRVSSQAAILPCFRRRKRCRIRVAVHGRRDKKAESKTDKKTRRQKAKKKKKQQGETVATYGRLDLERRERHRGLPVRAATSEWLICGTAADGRERWRPRWRR
jgi:hypothetical protein